MPGEILMLFAFLNPETILFLCALGVLVFGRRMPELGRSLGQTFVEFKKGMNGLEDKV
jgi:sec-independent protein translocase protein TatA